MFATALSALMALGLVACGGGEAGVSVTPDPGSAAAAAPTAAARTAEAAPAVVVTPPAVSAVLNLDLAALANYAAPRLPAYYDAAVAAMDNTPPGDAVSDRIATLGRVSERAERPGSGH